VQIAHATEARIREAFEALASSGVDAIVQAGTDLAVADLAENAERWLGRPMIPINTATYWSALRHCGIEDRRNGFGSLLAEH
jgi:maleate isomerase